MELSGAGEHDYDGIPYSELELEVVIWTEERTFHIEERSRRKGSRDEIDIKVAWTLEAAADPLRLIRAAGSRSGLSVQVVGQSYAAGRVLAVYLLPNERPPRGSWSGVTARVASTGEGRDYERGRVDE